MKEEEQVELGMKGEEKVELGRKRGTS